MENEDITFDRLTSLSCLAGLACGAGMETRRATEAVMNSVIRDARSGHYPVGSFIISFAEGYAKGRALATEDDNG